LTGDGKPCPDPRCPPIRTQGVPCGIHTGGAHDRSSKGRAALHLAGGAQWPASASRA
jgi:hypothetical protein